MCRVALARQDGSYSGDILARSYWWRQGGHVLSYPTRGPDQRSMRALEFLHQAGYRKLKNLRGGIDAWSRLVDPTIPRY